MEGVAMVLEAMFRGRRIDRHAADGIAHLHAGSMVVVMMVSVTGVIAMSLIVMSAAA
jgi:hypothetical protein